MHAPTAAPRRSAPRFVADGSARTAWRAASCAVLVAGAWAWSAAAAPPAAHAAPPQTDADDTPVVATVERETKNLVVTTYGCDGLSAHDVARLLDLELQSVTEEIRDGPPLRVELTCKGDRLAIAVLDPLTDKRLERTVPSPGDEPGRERVIALQISQLFSASWLELLAAPPPIEVTGEDDEEAPIEKEEPPPAATEAARDLAVDTLRPRRTVELLVGAGARGRGLETADPFPASHVQLRLRAWLTPAIAIVGLAGWDFGQAERRNGLVRGHVVGLGGGLGWAWFPRRRPTLGVGGHALVSTAFARIAGVPSAPDVPSFSRAGVTGEGLLGVGPRIRSGAFRLDLDVEAGAMLRSPEGLVDGESAVSMGGLWVGAVLRVGGVVRAAAPEPR